jgi:hypothetical protein
MSLVFNGTSSYVSGNITNMMKSGTTFTVEMWVYLPSSADLTGKTQVFLQVIDNSILKYSLSVVNNFLTGPGGTGAVNLYLKYNDWNHIALMNGDTNFISILINGTSRSVSSFGLNPNTITGSSQQIYIGGAPGVVSTNQLIYNFQYISGTRKYNTNGFTLPSPALPTNSNLYDLILYADYKNVILGGELANLNPTAIGLQNSAVTFTNVTTSTSMPSGGSFPFATICFVAGSLVLTDQDGYVPIEQLNTDKHTINGSPILAVTQSVTPERYLVKIEAGALSTDSPSVDTLITINHKILHEGVMTESHKLTSGTSFVEYRQQTLYNVVLKDHGTMTVNNMVVETLDPENLLAKVFIAMKGLTAEQREVMILNYNNYIKWALANSESPIQ